MPVEGRSLGSRQTQETGKDRRLGNLQTPESVQRLRTALHAKAKEEPGYRFYLLYDKMYRADILAHAYRCCKANKGAAGADGQKFEDIDAYGEERWLGELAERLRKKGYRPEAVKRVWIPKSNGKLRPLGIPTITDRVVQTAAMLVLEPIFEADLQPEQYGYRPDRGAHDAIRAIHRLLNTGHTEIVDADLSGYFDSIPHVELMKSIARRIVDKHVLHLIKMWLEAPVEEADGKGNRKRTTLNRDGKRGSPQGSPISPLLSNVYMRRFIVGWKQLGMQHRWSAHIVNFADDFVICCKGRAEDAMEAMRSMMERLKLTVNDDKTHQCRLPQESFDFLGYTFGRCYSRQSGRAYIGTRVAKKSIKRMVETISRETERRMLLLEADEIVGRLNRKLTGWANYFCLGPVSPVYRAMDRHATQRLRWWLCKKHKVSGRGTTRYPNQYLYEQLGLVNLPARTRNFPWAKA
jgi:RNA-directed DNA polymerase